MKQHPHPFKGWICKIGEAHEGPCPLVPTRWTRIKEFLKGHRIPRDS